MNSNIKIIDHVILKHKLGLLRDKETSSHEFRNLMGEISEILAYEATADLPMQQVQIETQLSKTQIEKIAAPPIVVSIMRAGNGMLSAVLKMLPFASAGHIGIYRDKFINNTVEYYFKIPAKPENKKVLLLDPLLATGDTAIASVDRLKQYKVGEIRFLTILASQHGLKRLHHFHPDVKIYTLSVNEELNEQGYLVPGLGDAGDRLFQSK
ncbi:MAG: uracil phosphoribosyltransferase [Halobacteriovoraceae bacterium]|nr:uracil phosphoribosyltransferase [Halobacteriovoraceae bacterium]MCB9095223.1 uracil phosphoribosyltransferase [Halobacteriovoraceae bacterium]